MSDVRGTISRVLFIALAGVWAGIMAMVGLWVVFDLPGRFDLYSPWLNLGGKALIAAGVFVFAWVVGRCFPLASTRLKLGLEVLPWLILGLALIGGVA